MKYNVQATLQPSGHEYGYGVTILKSNQTQLYTSVPVFDGKNVPLSPGDSGEITYYFGTFQFIFHVRFQELVLDAAGEEEAVELYHFVINEMNFAPNVRKDRREAVDFNAFVADSKGQYHGKVLDVSKDGNAVRGVKLRLEESLHKKNVNVFFFDESGENIEIKGKVMWTKKGAVYYYYGIEVV